MIMIVNHESKTKDMLCKTKSEFLFECSQMSTRVQLESQTYFTRRRNKQH